MFGKSEMDPMASMLMQMEDQPIHVVAVHLHKGVSEGTALYKIDKAVGGRNDLAKSVYQSYPPGDATRIGEMKRADSVVGQASKHLTENHFTAPRRDVLEHDERMKEIEVAG